MTTDKQELPEIRFIERHGNVVPRHGTWITENEHWIVNDVHFNHEPSLDEIDQAYTRPAKAEDNKGKGDVNDINVVEMVAPSREKE